MDYCIYSEYSSCFEFLESFLGFELLYETIFRELIYIILFILQSNRASPINHFPQKKSAISFWTLIPNLYMHHYKFMQIIDRPKQHILPFTLKKKVFSQQKSIDIPEINIGKISHRHKSITKNNKKINYEFNIDDNNLRPFVRNILAKQLTFNTVVGKDRYSPDLQILKIKENYKALEFSAKNTQNIVERVKDIFGEDFSIKERQLLIVQGQITKKFFIFFTSRFKPFSLCCEVPIYIKAADFEQNDFLKEEIFMNSHKKIKKITGNTIFRTSFICSQCQKTVLQMVGRPKPDRFINTRERIKQKQQNQMQIQRKKISLSVMFGSGNYRRGIFKRQTNSRYNKLENKGNSISLLPQFSQDALQKHQRQKTIENDRPFCS